MNFPEINRITIDPAVMGGKPCIRGMRVTVGMITGLVASGASFFFCCKSYCLFLKLLIVLPIPFSLLHLTPPKVLKLYYNLTFRCVHYFGGSAITL